MYSTICKSKTLKKIMSVILTIVIFASVCIYAKANSNERATLSSQVSKYVNYESGFFTVDDVKMFSDGYCKKDIELVSSTYKEINNVLGETSSSKNCLDFEDILTLNDLDDNEMTRNPAGAAIKGAAKWLKKNWDNVLAKLPAPVKEYIKANIGANVVFEIIDKYVAISDTVDEFLTNVFNAILPDWLEWATPGIVAVVTTLLPLP